MCRGGGGRRGGGMEGGWRGRTAGRGGGERRKAQNELLKNHPKKLFEVLRFHRERKSRRTLLKNNRGEKGEKKKCQKGQLRGEEV